MRWCPIISPPRLFFRCNSEQASRLHCTPVDQPQTASCLWPSGPSEKKTSTCFFGQNVDCAFIVLSCVSYVWSGEKGISETFQIQKSLHTRRRPLCFHVFPPHFRGWTSWSTCKKKNSQLWRVEHPISPVSSAARDHKHLRIRHGQKSWPHWHESHISTTWKVFKTTVTFHWNLTVGFNPSEKYESELSEYESSPH